MARLIRRGRDLILELRRRHVIRVAAAYAVAAWLVVQVATQTFPFLRIPDWVTAAVIVVTLLGFPVALLLAWAFDMTPDGIRRHAEGDGDADPTPMGAALSTPSTSLRPLPAPGAPLVGRSEELSFMTAALADRSTRLLTLRGPGGVGKTRLALEAAHAAADSFAGGVCFVPLADVGEEEPLAAVLARYLGGPTGREEPAEWLAVFLRHREMLLVLDNLDHLTEQAKVIGELLAAAPGVEVLCTSREPLGLEGEQILPIDGLPCPAPGEAWGGGGAVELFVQVASRFNPAFRPDEKELASVVALCRRLEGVPLAIELAAAWVGSLSCTEIAAQIEADQDFLVGTRRDGPERHRSMRAVFEWSWRLLDEEEQRAFRRLSAFRGGFTREAAGTVCGAPLPVLSQLVRKSLLARRATGLFEVHPILHQYAEERLSADPLEAAMLQERHGRHYAELLQRAGGGLDDAGEAEAFGAVEREFGNAREGWRWAVRERRAEEMARSLDGLYRFLNARGWVREGAELLTPALAAVRRGGEDESRLRARLQVRLGGFLQELGQYERARELLLASLEDFRTLGLRDEAARAMNRLGVIANQQGEHERAEEYLRESLAAYRECQDAAGTARTLLDLGAAAFAGGDYAQARSLFSESLRLSRSDGYATGVSMALKNLGGLAFEEQRYPEARELLLESLAIDRERDNRRGIAYALQNLGCTSFRAGESAAAEGYLREGLALARELGLRRLEAGCLNELANLCRDGQRISEAWECYRAALSAAMEIDARPIVLEVILDLSRLLHRNGENEQAFVFLSLILAEQAAGESTRADARELLGAIFPLLPAGRAEALSSQVGAESLQQALAPLLHDPVVAYPGAKAASPIASQ